MTPSPAIAAQPIRWQICFVDKAETWWVNRLVPGRFKHVRAFGFVPGEGVWVFYDVSLSGTCIAAARDKSEMADLLIGAWIKGAEVLAMKPQPARCFPAGFWCVTAVKHLIGLRSGALRPDSLYRDCRRNGAQIFDGREGTAPTASPAA